MNKKTVAILCFGLVIIAAVGVRKLMFEKPFLYAATLETTKVYVASKVTSDIVSLPVYEGDEVKAGQEIAELSCDTYKVLARQIDNDFERAAALVKKGHVSQADYDVAERNKRDNDLKLEWCHIKAPLNGIVITKYKEIGEIAAAGESIVSVVNPYDVWAYFYVPHNEIYRLKVGQKITAVLPEDNNRKFIGRIIKISEEAEFTPKNVQTRDERTRLVYGVKVQFENADLTLKSGMTLESSLNNE